METIAEKQLSSELQELYLKNKEWLSDILFLEDEMRFFKKLFNKATTLAINESRIGELYPVNNSLAQLGDKRQELKALVLKHQQLLASLIKDQSKPLGIELLNDNALITKEINSLFVEDKAVRKNLYTLSEKVFDGGSKAIC